MCAPLNTLFLDWKYFEKMVEKEIQFLETFWKLCLFFPILTHKNTEKMADFRGLGGVAEWLNAAVLKTANGATRSGVRIPPPPPIRSFSKYLNYFRVYSQHLDNNPILQLGNNKLLIHIILDHYLLSNLEYNGYF